MRPAESHYGHIQFVSAHLIIPDSDCQIIIITSSCSFAPVFEFLHWQQYTARGPSIKITLIQGTGKRWSNQIWNSFRSLFSGAFVRVCACASFMTETHWKRKCFSDYTLTLVIYRFCSTLFQGVSSPALRFFWQCGDLWRCEEGSDGVLYLDGRRRGLEWQSTLHQNGVPLTISQPSIERRYISICVHYVCVSAYLLCLFLFVCVSAFFSLCACLRERFCVRARCFPVPCVHLTVYACVCLCMLGWMMEAMISTSAHENRKRNQIATSGGNVTNALVIKQEQLGSWTRQHEPLTI